MCKAEDNGWSKVQFAQRQVLKAVHGGGIVGKDFDGAIQIYIGCAEKAPASDGPE